MLSWMIRSNVQGFRELSESCEVRGLRGSVEQWLPTLAAH